jgi:uncharacterized protein YbcI
VSTEPPATSTSPRPHDAGASRLAASDVRQDAQTTIEPVSPNARPRASDDGDSLVSDAGGVMFERGPLKGGELNAAVTSALVGIHTEYLGRGPRSASTFHYGNVLVTLMHDVLTNAEKSLARTSRGEAVKHMRQLFQGTMEADFCAAVERLTGRKVIAFISGNQLDPDIAAELFILDQPL